MALFVEPWKNNNLDWRLLRNGTTTLYWKLEFLEKAISELKKLAYDIFIFDSSNWKNQQDFHDNAKAVLHFPDYYGMNLNAFTDCIGDVESKNTGTVIVFKAYDSFMKKDNESGWKILDILEYQSRNLLLFGQRLIVLVQVEDPQFTVPALGGRAALWNQNEWLDKNRVK
jgi:RNAse (barnase) inhibitor barstar